MSILPDSGDVQDRTPAIGDPGLLSQDEPPGLCSSEVFARACELQGFPLVEIEEDGPEQIGELDDLDEGPVTPNLPLSSATGVFSSDSDSDDEKLWFSIIKNEKQENAEKPRFDRYTTWKF